VIITVPAGVWALQGQLVIKSGVLLVIQGQGPLLGTPLAGTGDQLPLSHWQLPDDGNSSLTITVQPGEVGPGTWLTQPCLYSIPSALLPLDAV
jgi:hypothetical protein